MMRHDENLLVPVLISFFDSAHKFSCHAIHTALNLLSFLGSASEVKILKNKTKHNP